jgi:hypothetical protein
MNKQEAIQKIEELKKFVESHDAKELLVPDTIWIEKFGGGGMGIKFPNRDASLRYSSLQKGCTTDLVCNLGSDRVPCKLVPCNREDFKKGDIAFRTDDEEPDTNDLSNYCVILDYEYYAYISVGTDIVEDGVTYPCWYKVVPRSEE